MKQTRGAIKFLLAEYRAILKHALLAMFMSTVAVSVADADTNINSQADFDSAITTQPSGYYLSHAWGKVQPTVNIGTDVTFNPDLMIGYYKLIGYNNFYVNIGSSNNSASLSVDGSLSVYGGSPGYGATYVNLGDNSYIRASNLSISGDAKVNANSSSSIYVDGVVSIQSFTSYQKYTKLQLSNGSSLKADQISVQDAFYIGDESSRGSQASTTGNVTARGDLRVYNGNYLDIGGDLYLDGSEYARQRTTTILGKTTVAGKVNVYSSYLNVGSADSSSEDSSRSELDVKEDLTIRSSESTKGEAVVNDGALLNIGDNASINGSLTVGTANSTSSKKATFNATNVSLGAANSKDPSSLRVNTNGVLSADSIVINNGNADINGQADVLELTIDDGVLTVGIEDSSSANKATVYASNISVGGTNSSLTVNTNGVLTSDSLAINNGKADLKGQVDVGDLTVKNGTSVNVTSTGSLTTKGKVDIGEDASSSTGKLSIDAASDSKSANFVVDDDSILNVYVASNYELKGGRSDIKGTASFHNGLDIGDGTKTAVQNVSGELTVELGDTNVKQNASLNISGSKRSASSDTDYATNLNGNLNIDGKVNVKEAGILHVAGDINVNSKSKDALKVGLGSSVIASNGQSSSKSLATLKVADGAEVGTVSVDGGDLEVQKVIVASGGTANNAGVIALTNGANFIVDKAGTVDKTAHTIENIQQNTNNAFSADASSTLTVNGLGEFESLEQLQKMRESLLGADSNGTLDGDYTLSSDVTIDKSMTYENAKSDTYKGVTVLKNTQVTGVGNTVEGTNTWGNVELADGNKSLTVQNGSLTLSDSTANKNTDSSDSYLVAYRDAADRQRQVGNIVLNATGGSTATVKFTGSGIVANITANDKGDSDTSTSLVVVDLAKKEETVTADSVIVDKLNVKSGILAANGEVKLRDAVLANGGIKSNSTVTVDGSVIANGGKISGSSVNLTGDKWKDTDVYYAGNGSSIEATAGNVIVAKENDFILENSSITAKAKASDSTDTGSISLNGKVQASGSSIYADNKVAFNSSKTLELEDTTVKSVNDEITVAGDLVANKSSLDGGIVTLKKEATLSNGSRVNGTNNVSFESNLIAQNSEISGGVITVAGTSSLNKKSTVNGSGDVTFANGLTADQAQITGANVIVENADKDIILTDSSITANVNNQDGSVDLAGNLFASQSTIAGGAITLNKEAMLTYGSKISGTEDVTFKQGLIADQTQITGANVIVENADKDISLTNSSITANLNNPNGSVKLAGALTASNATIAGGKVELNKTANLSYASKVSGTESVSFKSDLTAKNSEISGGTITVEGTSSLTNESKVNGTNVTFEHGLTADSSQITGASVNVKDVGKTITLSNSSITSQNGSVSLAGALTATKSTIAGSDITLNKAATLKDNSIVVGTNNVAFKSDLTAQNSEILGAKVTVDGASSLSNASKVTGIQEVSFAKGLSAEDSEITGASVAVNGDKAATLTRSKILSTGTADNDGISFGNNLVAVSSGIDSANNLSLAQGGTVKDGYILATGKMSVSGMLKLDPSFGYAGQLDLKNNGTLAILKDSIFKVGGVTVTSDNSAEGIAELILENDLDLGTSGKIYLDGTKTNSDLTAEPSNQVTLGPKSKLTINQGAIDAANATQSTGDAVIKMSDTGGIAVSEGASIDINLNKIKIETIKLFGQEVSEDGKSILNSASFDLYINNLLYTAVVDNADSNTVINVKLKDNVKSEIDGLDPSVVDTIISQASGDGFDTTQDNGLGYISKLLQEDTSKAVQGIGSLTSFGFASYAPQVALLADDAAFHAVSERAGFNTQSGSTLGTVNGDTASVWITPLYRKQSSDSFDAGSKSYGAKTNLYGVALGADFALPYNLRAGASLHVGNGKAKGDGDFIYTQNKFNFFGAEIYGFYTADNLSVLADLGYTHISNDVDQEGLSADFDSKVISAGIKGKYLFATENLDIEPHAGIRFSHAKVDGFKVKSSNGTLLNADSMDGNLFKIPVGVTISKTFQDDEWSVKPLADLSLIGAFGDKNWSFDSRITGMTANGGKVSVDADVVDGLSISGTLGVEAQKGNTLSVGAGYTFTKSSNIKDHALTASFRYAF